MAARPPRRNPAPSGPPPERRKEGGSDLARRVLVAIPAVAFAIFIVVEGGLVFALALAAFAIVSMHELFTMLARTRPVSIAGFLAALALMLCALYGDQFQVLLVTVASVPVVFVVSMLRPQREDETSTLGIAVTLLAIVWIGLAFAHAVLLRGLPHGDGIVIDVLVGAFVGDTCAYLGGRAFGTRPLAPLISPNKTVEGLLIGMAGAVLGVWFAGLYQDWLSGLDALIIGAGVAIAAPIGDLFESRVKRDAGVKDSGRLFGAHGGALDRLDAVLFAVVVGYYIWFALQ